MALATPPPTREVSRSLKRGGEVGVDRGRVPESAGRLKLLDRSASRPSASADLPVSKCSSVTAVTFDVAGGARLPTFLGPTEDDHGLP
jgi:hypothetical protein